MRLLSDGMEPDAILHRLFGEQLSGATFPNAAEIVRQVTAHLVAEHGCAISVIGSGYWLDALERTHSYQSNARQDVSEPVSA